MSERIQNALKIQIGGDHYRTLKPQPIELSITFGLGFIEGNVCKYICRYPFKGGRQDLQKVAHYSQFLSVIAPICIRTSSHDEFKSYFEEYCARNKFNAAQSNLLQAFGEYLDNPSALTRKNIEDQANLTIKELNSSDK